MQLIINLHSIKQLNVIKFSQKVCFNFNYMIRRSYCLLIIIYLPFISCIEYPVNIRPSQHPNWDSNMLVSAENIIRFKFFKYRTWAFIISWKRLQTHGIPEKCKTKKNHSRKTIQYLWVFSAVNTLNIKIIVENSILKKQL